MPTKKGEKTVVCLHISTCTDPLHGTIKFLDMVTFEGGTAGFPYLLMYKGVAKVPALDCIFGSIKEFVVHTLVVKGKIIWWNCWGAILHL